jgi:alpha-L-fucosidase
LSGFKYLTHQRWWGSGIITNYVLFISEDGNERKEIDAGEFSNIKNNPVWQIKTFEPVKARYQKLQDLHNTQDNDAVGYAEFDFITN